MPKFKAPKHTTQVFGPHSIFTADSDGLIDTGEKLSDPDRDALRRAGCVEVAAESPPAPPPPPPPPVDEPVAGQDASASAGKAKA